MKLDRVSLLFFFIFFLPPSLPSTLSFFLSPLPLSLSLSSFSPPFLPLSSSLLPSSPSPASLLSSSPSPASLLSSSLSLPLLPLSLSLSSFSPPFLSRFYSLSFPSFSLVSIPFPTFPSPLLLLHFISSSPLPIPSLPQVR